MGSTVLMQHTKQGYQLLFLHQLCCLSVSRDGDFCSTICAPLLNNRPFTESLQSQTSSYCHKQLCYCLQVVIAPPNSKTVLMEMTDNKSIHRLMLIQVSTISLHVFWQLSFYLLKICNLNRDP
ncbi:hypothetical protein XENOCAPTIV_005750 [Xenoophorus captivus]|uniref:Uncharacterized protein n=1 Tax=Xenoophorus captivus TaxID=1517983 RepID=A0ABV0RKD7_9TELE